ncbi:shikimate dehydrogenase family protein [Bosea sp. (in: a-proteobacteria)]|jgi:shikimate dehydrogenase|uniref:shikimate dehydrogenase family protein n=1 Tax=Bosea sp. (in: a-proteobacteria) TaxID=1871050 RepID=UPI003F710C15
MLDGFSGATRVYFIIGHPIAQVKSPYGMTRLLEENGKDAIMVPIDILPADVPGFVELAGRMPNCDGICITVPHKFAVVPHCRTMSKTTELLGSANVMRRNADGSWHGDMFDGPGHVGAMLKNGAQLEGKRALLIGAGGAGSAIGLALLDAGLRELAIHDADASRRDALIGKLAQAHPGKVAIGSPDPSGFDSVSNATPAGMKEGDPLPIEIGKLAPSTFVSDVVTKPALPPLIEAARRLGCPNSTGIEMFEAETSLMLNFWLETAR